MLFREFLIFRSFGWGQNVGSGWVWQRKIVFIPATYYQPIFFLKTNLITAITVITCVIYAIFVVQKCIFFMTVELSYNRHNNTISLISEVLIGHTWFIVCTSPLSAGNCQGLNFPWRLLEKRGWLFSGGWAVFT